MNDMHLKPWFEEAKTGIPDIDSLILTALDRAKGNWDATTIDGGPHPYEDPEYLTAIEGQARRWDMILPVELFAHGLTADQWSRLIAAMNDLGRFGLSDMAVVRRDPEENPDESVYAPYDDWETADYEAFRLSGPRVEYVVYDLRALAEQMDENPKRSDGLIRYDTKYALAGFDYLTFVETPFEDA